MTTVNKFVGDLNQGVRDILVTKRVAPGLHGVTFGTLMIHPDDFAKLEPDARPKRPIRWDWEDIKPKTYDFRFTKEECLNIMTALDELTDTEGFDTREEYRRLYRCFEYQLNPEKHP